MTHSWFLFYTKTLCFYWAKEFYWAVSLARDKFLAIHLLGIIYCVDVLYPLLSLRTEMEWKIRGKKWNTTDSFYPSQIKPYMKKGERAGTETLGAL